MERDVVNIIEDETGRRVEQVYEDVVVQNKDGIETIKRKPKRYTPTKHHIDCPQIGLIAEEVEQAGLSELVVHNQDEIPDSVKYDKLAIILLKEIKRLNERITALENA